MQEHILTTLDNACDQTKLEVALLQDPASEPVIELRSMTWGSGIGWYRQQTLVLDAHLAQALARFLRQVHPEVVPAEPTVRKDNVIPFPQKRGTSPSAPIDRVAHRNLKDHAM